MSLPGPRQDDVRPMAAGHVIVVVVVALLGGALFNAQALTAAAASQPFGWKRQVAVVAVTPFRGLSGVLGLNRPHAVLAGAAAAVTGQPGPVEPAPAPATGDPVAEPAEDVAQPGPGEEVATPQRPTESATSRRDVSRRDPLRVWVGGDSLASEFGPALADRLARTELAKTEVEFRFSTGLARPDFFDWRARLTQIARQQDPDVFIVMFGANDGQDIEVKGEVLEFGSEAWRAEYSKRVAAVMDALPRDGRTLYWVGQPIMRSADFDAKMQVLNDVYESAARGREAVTYIDTRRLFQDPRGAYSAYLPDAQGQRTLMRQQDGVHLTRAGGERLTTSVLAPIEQRWKLTRASR